jgi:hypothetical protein
MPAIEPGWDAFLAGAAAYTDMRAASAEPFLFLLDVVAPPLPWPTVVAPTLVRSCSRARLCRRSALAQMCTPARARANQRGQGRSFGPFSLAPDLAMTLPPARRTAMALTMEICLTHEAAGERSAIFVADPCMPRHRSSHTPARVCA